MRMLDTQTVRRTALVVGAMWTVLCVFWQATDQYRGFPHDHDFWAWWLSGLALIGLATLGLSWAIRSKDSRDSSH